MKLIKKIRTDGLCKTCRDIYEYQIDECIIRVLKVILRNKPLKNIIVIESHNDFDCNGGAFYDFLIENEYNKKYKIVWLLKHPDKKPEKLPPNVECVSLFKPSIKKDYYNVIAKYFTSDNYNLKKQRPEQKFYFFSHGCGGLKNVKGKMIIQDDFDYILFQSEKYAPIQAEQYSLKYPSDRIVYLGYPAHDVMYKSDRNEINKVVSKKYDKVIIWMPTFRRGGGTGRNDSLIEQPLGIPLLRKKDQYLFLNNYLKKRNSFLIIKLHPMQDLTNLKIRSMSNISVLTGEKVKQKHIDNYRLLPCTDAMLSDYSGIAYEYLQLDKPIAYVLDDMNEYKLGFVTEDIDSLLAGEKIFSFEDFLGFIDDVVNEDDKYKVKREQIRDYIYKYHDGKSCERIAKFMGLKKS